MGFDGLFFGRVDYQDYTQRNATKTMEMIWKGSTNLGQYIETIWYPKVIFTFQIVKVGCLPVFCHMVMIHRLRSVMIFSVIINPSWSVEIVNNCLSLRVLLFQDDPTLHDYNVPERVQAFIQAAHDEVRIYVNWKNIFLYLRFLALLLTI
jgi:hypothetical protein